MAIVFRGKSKCSLCEAILSGEDDIVMFPHFIPDRAHPLWCFSDSAMHRACFKGWSQAEAFRLLFNKAWPELVPNHPREMTVDGSIVERGRAT
jgi:hypothetical protein